MDKIDKIGLFAEIFSDDGFCHLNHGPDIHEDIAAVDYLVIPIEHKETKHTSELTIPICEHCLYGLDDPEWVLILCINCISSQWIARSKAKLHYINEGNAQQYRGIILNGCPKCTKEFNGICFIS